MTTWTIRAVECGTTTVLFLNVRYTPFGKGLVTLALDPANSNIDNRLNLWHINNLKAPVYTFFGHHGLVTEFCWRNR